MLWLLNIWNDRCWHAGAPTLDMIVYGLNEALSKEEAAINKSEIENALKLWELLDRKQNTLKEISEKGQLLIEKYGDSQIQSENLEKQFFFALCCILKIRADPQKSNDEIEDFLNDIKQLTG